MAMFKALLLLQRDDVRGPLQLVLQSHSGPHSDSPHLFPHTATLQADIFSWESHNRNGLYKFITILPTKLHILQRSSQKKPPTKYRYDRQICDRYVIHICFIFSLDLLLSADSAGLFWSWGTDRWPRSGLPGTSAAFLRPGQLSSGGQTSSGSKTRGDERLLSS